MTDALPLADRAVEHILDRIRTDGRLAYLLGYGTESYSLLIAAHCERTGKDVESWGTLFWVGCCKPVRVHTS